MKLEEYIRRTVESRLSEDALALKRELKTQDTASFYDWYNRIMGLSASLVRLGTSGRDGHYMRSDCYWVEGSYWVTEDEYCDSYFCCDTCDRYLHNDAYGSDGHCESCEQSDPDTDDYGVPDYHDQARPWDDNPPRKNAALFGIELEVLVKNENDVSSVYERIVDHGFIGERDGSLHPVRGIEIVGEPLTFEKNKSKWLPLLGHLRGVANGWDAGVGYGMHVSVNRPALSKMHQGKLLVFIHNSKTLCETVAGRKESHWAQYHSNKKVSDAEKETDEKYQAITLRGYKRMEVRIFRSTISTDGFMRNLEFVAAAVEFTRVTGVRSLDESTFRAWMNKPSQRKAYKSLYRTLEPEKAREADEKKAKFAASKAGK